MDMKGEQRQRAVRSRARPGATSKITLPVKR